MPAHVQPDSKITVALWRNGECLDARTAPTTKEAVKAALMLIVQQGELLAGRRSDERHRGMTGSDTNRRRPRPALYFQPGGLLR
jgi:hypothetical protein